MTKFDYVYVMDTALDAEEKAYPEGTLGASRRRFRAVCPDGKRRNGVCSVSDSFGLVPARLNAYGRKVTGFVSFKSGATGSYIVFTPTGKNADVFLE